MRHIHKMTAPGLEYRALLGALVGDAAGATLEFVKRVTPDTVARAMTMPGGGRLLVGPGQITDDGELTLTLLRSLRTQTGDAIDMKALKRTILKGYAEWLGSGPFDVGNTCENAFMAAGALLDGTITEARHTEILEEHNGASLSNGALMRASAIPTWALIYEKTLAEALEVARLDARSSHSNPICSRVNVCYVEALYSLLRGGRQDRVYRECLVNYPDLAAWMKIDIREYSCLENIGFLRHAFVLAFYFLRHPEITYEEAIRTVLLKGGDTDTNAAIVGGLVACYQPIPEYMLRPVVQFNGERGHPRPAQYRPSAVLGREHEK